MSVQTIGSACSWLVSNGVCLCLSVAEQISIVGRLGQACAEKKNIKNKINYYER